MSPVEPAAMTETYAGPLVGKRCTSWTPGPIACPVVVAAETVLSPNLNQTVAVPRLAMRTVSGLLCFHGGRGKSARDRIKTCERIGEKRNSPYL